MPAIALQLNARLLKPGPANSEAVGLRQGLDPFLRGVERRALRMAELSTGNREDALEIVQDSMFAFARHYASRPEAEWPPLFHRVLDSRILDFHRRQKVRSRWLSWLPSTRSEDTEGGGDLLAVVADGNEPGPLQRLADGQTGAALDNALRALPLRQRQCFLLRVWEGLDVAATAQAMRCSEGSVKTHLSRALAALRMRLEAHHD